MNTVYFAKHILLESGEVLANGAVSVCGELIADVGPRGKVRRGGDERLVNLGDMLLLPGLINMHTHLEESPIRGFRKEPEETFAAWSGKKNSQMRRLTDEQVRKGIGLCAMEMISHGTTTVADNARSGIPAQALANQPIRSAVILEVAGAEFLKEGIDQMRQWQDGGTAFRYGIGPRAFYSLTPREHRRLIKYGYDTGCLWACHAAESAEEVEAFCEQSGDFFRGVTRKKPWPADSRLGPLHYALAEGLIPTGAILFHCNYVTGNELALLAAKRAFVTLCPKYGAEMEHRDFPAGAASRRGIRICLGTEGITPPGETNLFDELFHMKKACPHISAVEMLQWVTKNPAAALKASDKLGSITPGKYADIIGVRFPCAPNEDLLETLLMSDPEIAFVMIGGEEIIADVDC
jgi:cytosine/adenosine deaminase-related metal-dependent hydrolase